MYKKLLLFCLLITLFIGHVKTTLAQTSQSENRGVWLQDDVDLDNKLQKLKDMHFNVIYFGVWGARSLSLQTIIDKVHSKGMQIHLWDANAYLCAGHWRDCAAFSSGKDTWDAKLPNGMTRGGLNYPGVLGQRWIDFSIPEVQQNSIKVMVDWANNYNADGIHYDYIRYDSGNYSFSDHNLSEFSQRNGIDPAIMRGDNFPAFGTVWGNRVSGLTSTATAIAMFHDNVPAIILNNYTGDTTGKHGQVLTFNWQVSKISFKVMDTVFSRAINYFNAAPVYILKNGTYNDYAIRQTPSWLSYLGVSSTKIDFTAANINALPANSTLVIPEIYYFTDETVLALDTYLKKGANVIFIDGPTPAVASTRTGYTLITLFRSIIGATRSDSYIGNRGRESGVVSIPTSVQSHWLVSGLTSPNPITIEQATDYIAKWQLYMEEGITAVVAEVARQIREIKPNLKISAAIFPAQDSRQIGVHQNWPLWIDNNYLDYAIPMEYTLDSTKFTALTNWITSRNYQERVFPGLGPLNITDCNQLPILTNQIDQMRNLGIKGFSMFESNYLTESNKTPAGCGIASALTNYFGQDVDPFFPIINNQTPTPIFTPGDANGDGRVDGLDYVIWLNHYNQNVSGPSNGDFNNSGVVDGADYILWLTNYNG
ncbi:MAG: hypothetical protein US62_C0001G0015 [Candidatus Woesebacteria bacterium GW2011_GWA1_37_8]|uniref:Glycosyl hydrolase-like 10 domain-containing protein n=2 Tax=Candidatus Woeseibacteriota TaxID=1752722 RepID=A0A0G0LIQ3_9BACT|nr:MAG: hypothetical protein US62_C0001G0015 [Candidatus Woesebacteria bacterium GW2011_GWA1_37_8]KKQ87800.1 MAG: hypothetical protein UT10_C0001G0041 [Candidatus Woesebacteria bacterium GW2011_GWB1_38_8b]